MFLLKTRGRILWWGELRASRRGIHFHISPASPSCVTYQLRSVSTRENVNEPNHQIERRNEKKKGKKRFSGLNAGLLTWDTLSSRHETVEIVIFTGTLTWMASPGVKWVINPPLTRWAPRNWWLVKTEDVCESWESWEERVRRHWSVSGGGCCCHEMSWRVTMSSGGQWEHSEMPRGQWRRVAVRKLIRCASITQLGSFVSDVRNFESMGECWRSLPLQHTMDPKRKQLWTLQQLELK